MVLQVSFRLAARLAISPSLRRSDQASVLSTKSAARCMHSLQEEQEVTTLAASARPGGLGLLVLHSLNPLPRVELLHFVRHLAVVQSIVGLRVLARPAPPSAGPASLYTHATALSEEFAIVAPQQDILKGGWDMRKGKAVAAERSQRRSEAFHVQAREQSSRPGMLTEARSLSAAVASSRV